jgi:hypothetical protein
MAKNSPKPGKTPKPRSTPFSPHLEPLEDRLVLTDTDPIALFPVEKLDQQIGIPIVPLNVEFLGPQTIVTIRDILSPDVFADGIVTIPEVLDALRQNTLPEAISPFFEPFGSDPRTGVVTTPAPGFIVDERELPFNPEGTARRVPLGMDPGEFTSIVIQGTIDEATIDEDFFVIELRAGDVLGGAATGIIFPEPGEFPDQLRLDTNLQVIAPDGRVIWDNEDAFLFPTIYPPESPLPRTDPNEDFGFGLFDAAIGLVAPVDGLYIIRLGGFPVGAAPDTAAITLADSPFGPYELTLTVHRPGLEQAPVGSRQRIFIDFDGAVDALGQPFLPLADGLTGWNLDPIGDLDAVINAILAVIEENFNDLRSTGNNGNFDVTGIPGQYDFEILNSRDHGTMFLENPTFDRDPTVSRVVIGLAAFPVTGFLGLAEFIDPGNYSLNDTAWIDVTSLGNLDPFGQLFGLNLNFIPRATGVSIIDLIGRAVGNVASHEAGHYLGQWHTDPLNEVHAISDSGFGGLSFNESILGLGPDGIFGTADDFDPDFIDDRYFFLEEVGDGFINPLRPEPAIEQVPEQTAFGMSTGLQFPLIGQQNGIIAIDVSQSVIDTRGQDVNRDGVLNHLDDLNNDGIIGSVLDLAIGDLLEAHARRSVPFPFREGIGIGTVPLTDADRLAELPVNVALVIFGADAAIVDLSPAPGLQVFVNRLADDDGNGVSDFEDALRHLQLGRAELFSPTTVDASRTYYDAALSLVADIKAANPSLDLSPSIFVTLERPLTGETPPTLLIDNDVLIFSPIDGSVIPGHFQALIGAGGRTGEGTVDGANGQITGSGLITGNTLIGPVVGLPTPIFEFINFIDVDRPIVAPFFDADGIFDLGDTITIGPIATAPDTVESFGQFDIFLFTNIFGVTFVRRINWHTVSRIITDTTQLVTTLEFTVENDDANTNDNLVPLDGAFGDFRVISYFDPQVATQDPLTSLPVAGPNEDFLFRRGVVGQSSFRSLLTNAEERIGFRHGGVYLQGLGLQFANWDGWASDLAPDLRAAILAGFAAYSANGTIDTADLPPFFDPIEGSTGFGAPSGANAATAFAWTINAGYGLGTDLTDPVPNAPVVITTFLELDELIPNLVIPQTVQSVPVAILSDGSGRLGDISLVASVAEPIATLVLGTFRETGPIQGGFEFTTIAALSSVFREMRPGGPLLSGIAFSSSRPGPGAGSNRDGGFTPQQARRTEPIVVPQPIENPTEDLSQFASRGEFLSNQRETGSFTGPDSTATSSTSSRRNVSGGGALLPEDLLL